MQNMSVNQCLAGSPRSTSPLDKPTRALSLEDCTEPAVEQSQHSLSSPFAAASTGVFDAPQPCDNIGNHSGGGVHDDDTVAHARILQGRRVSSEVRSTSSEVSSGKRNVASAQRTGSSDPEHTRRKSSSSRNSQTGLSPSMAVRHQLQHARESLFPETSSGTLEYSTMDDLGPIISGAARSSYNDPWGDGFTSYASLALKEGESFQTILSRPESKAARSSATAPYICWGKAQAQGKRHHFEDRFSIHSKFRPAHKGVGSVSSAMVTQQPGLTAPTTPARGADTRQPGSAISRSNSTDESFPCSYAGVFDGHVAANAAQTAAQRLHVLLANELGTCTRDCNGELEAAAVKDALRRSFAAVDFEIVTDAARTGDRSGCTACIVLQLGKQLFCAHTGDSIAVLSRNGSPEKMTAASNHKVDDPVELKRILSKGGRVTDGGQRVASPNGRHSLNMSRALGDAEFKSPHRLLTALPDVKHVTLGPGDTTIIVATDGLWDVFTEGDAVQAVEPSIQGNITLKAAASGGAIGDLANNAAEALVRTAQLRGSGDDVTALVGVIRWDG